MIRINQETDPESDRRMLTHDDILALADALRCPRCGRDKRRGSALCDRCWELLPPQLRGPLESIDERDPTAVIRGLRAAANYFDVRFRSIRDFGGGRRGA